MGFLSAAESLGRSIESVFAMTDTVWERHANPWSGITRMPILPLLTLAIWSRDWIGAWALAPIGLLILWAWLNPRVFPPPRDTDNWMSKGVFGERVWLKRAETPIPERHATMLNALTLLSALGLPFYAYGLWSYDLGMTLLGMSYMLIMKLWFVDRCVWLYEEMSVRHAPYARWLRRAPSGA